MLAFFTTSARMVCCLIFSLFTMANCYGTQLSLNGIASYNELRQDYYIAALYLPERQSNGQLILQSEMAKKMKLLVTINAWSPRDWSKQWQNNIAINSPLADTHLIQQVKTFSRLLKHDLVKGDVIEISFQPDSGSQVLINEQLMQSTQDSHLFNAILNTWLGKLPPSRDFKQRVLALSSDQRGQVDLQALYINQVSDQRKSEILSWRSSDEEIQKQAQQKEKTAQQITELKKRLQARKQAKIAYRQQKLQEEKSLALQRKAYQSQQAALAVKQQDKLAKQAALAKTKRQQRAIQEKAYYKSLYHWKLYTAIRKNIHYPVWAREFNQEGLVKARFTIDKQGQVIDTQFNQEEVSNFLIEEVKSSIKEISGTIPPPKKLSGSQWQFALNHNFSFSSKKQNPVTQPIKPNHL